MCIVPYLCFVACCAGFYEAALQALYCLKARAEYELLPGAMQVYTRRHLHSHLNTLVVHFDNESC